MWPTTVARTIGSPGRSRIRPEPEGDHDDHRTVHHRRPWLPALNLLLAGGAAVLRVIAITSDDVGSITLAPAAR